MSDAADLFSSPVAKQALSEVVTRRILGMIEAGELKPGDRLPPERELATRLEVSRPSLREALRALSLLGVVNIRHGDGIRITELGPEQLLQPLHFLVNVEERNLDMLFEARKLLEAGLAGLAAERLTDEQLVELKRLVDEGGKVTGDSKAFLELDVAFHELIAQAAGNSFLERIATSLNMFTRASRAITVDLPGVRERSHQDHLRIYQALAKRNPEAANEAVLEHLSNVQSTVHSRKESKQ